MVVLPCYQGLNYNRVDTPLVETFDLIAVYDDAPTVVKRRHATQGPPRLAKARQAVIEVGDCLLQTAFSGTPANPAPNDANAILARAVIKLRQRDPKAGELFASVIHEHDVREGWLGLAIAHHFRG